MYVQHFAEFTDQAGPPAPSMSITSTTPTYLIAHQTGSTVVIQGSNTAWVNGVTTFSVSGLTGAAVTATSINNGTQVATLTVTTSTADTGGTLTFSDSLDAATAPAAVLANATTYTLTGPSSGTVNVASTNFTVAYAASTARAAAVVVTPSDGGAGGSFSPATVTLSADTAPAAATFTYTPTTVGARTISVTNNGGLSNPGNLTYTSNSSSTPGTPGDSNIVVSMNAFLVTAGTSWESVLYCQNLIKLAFTVPGSPTADQQTISLEVDVTTPGAWGAGFPTLTWSIDHGDTTYGANGNVALTSTVGTLVSGNVRRVALASGLAAGTHVLYLYIGPGSGTDSQNTWSSSVFKITRFCTAAGAQLTTATWPYARAKKWLHFGDSESSNDSWLWYVAEAMDAEVANVSKNGIGLTNNANATASSWPSAGVYTSGALDANVSWNKHWSGTSRMSGSNFSETPDYISVMLGSNDNGASGFQASLTAFLQALRTAAPSAWIFAIPSLNRATPFNITDAYAKHSPAVTAVADSKVKLIDLSSLHSGEMLLGMSSGSPSTPRASARAKDGEHPYILGDTRANGALNTTAEMAIMAYRLINALVNPGGGGGTGGGRRRFQ